VAGAVVPAAAAVPDARFDLNMPRGSMLIFVDGRQGTTKGVS
jgi:hypothetical protein